VLISDLFKIDDQGELIQVPKVEGDALSTYAYVVDHHTTRVKRSTSSVSV